MAKHSYQRTKDFRASFKPAVLVGGNKTENWIEQQLFGLDFDDGIRINPLMVN